jgi:predicted transcriptional regulator
LREHQTLDEAIALFTPAHLEEDAVVVPMLLVLDAENNLTGRLSRGDILMGLVPNLLDMDRLDKFAGKETEYPNLTFMYEEGVLAECGGNRNRRIRSLMRPVKFTLSADTHILEAVVALHHHNASCVPVTDDGAVVGILRFDEIFNAMCNTWCRLNRE